LRTKHIDVFFANYKNHSYRENIQRLLKRVNKEKIGQAITAEINWLPKDIKKQITKRDEGFNFNVTRFFNIVDYMIVFVKKFTCEAAFIFIMGIAMKQFDLKKYIKKDEDCIKNNKNKEISFGFYQIVTLHLTYEAHLSKQKRQIMGIKKGIFFT